VLILITNKLCYKLSTMADIFSGLVNHLTKAGLERDDAVIYLELTKAPSTHLRLSRTTGISRTKVYRITARLEKQGMIARRSDDTGKFLIALEPVFIEEKIREQQKEGRLQQIALAKAKAQLPLLQAFQQNDFTVHTYAGVDGMKQMQWHELKTKGELLAIGLLTYEELVGSRRWAEDFRDRVAGSNYKTREIVSRVPRGFDMRFTDRKEFLRLYTYRILDDAVLPVAAPMVIYNNTVAIYQVDRQRKFGTEIIHPGFAATMRAIFEHYWLISKVSQTHLPVPGKPGP
jgi:DNA-binding MarR family transcriptional regulator